MCRPLYAMAVVCTAVTQHLYYVCVCVSEAGVVPDFNSRGGVDLWLALLLSVPSQWRHSAPSAGVHLQCGHRQHVPIAARLPGTAPIHSKHSTHTAYS